MLYTEAIFQVVRPCIIVATKGFFRLPRFLRIIFSGWPWQSRIRLKIRGREAIVDCGKYLKLNFANDPHVNLYGPRSMSMKQRARERSVLHPRK